MNILIFLSLFLSSFFSAPATATFTGSVNLSNPWGVYYSNYTQTGNVSITIASTATGGEAHVKFTSNGSGTITFTGETILRGMTDGSTLPAGSYEIYFKRTASDTVVNVIAI